MLPPSSREVSPAQTILLAHKCGALASLKTGKNWCGGDTELFTTGAAPTVRKAWAVMDSSDIQRKKVAVIGGGLVSTCLDTIPIIGITFIIIIQ